LEDAENVQLAKELLSGDAGAFDHFVHAYHFKRFQYAYLMCGNEHAEEVSQGELRAEATDLAEFPRWHPLCESSGDEGSANESARGCGCTLGAVPRYMLAIDSMFRHAVELRSLSMYSEVSYPMTRATSPRILPEGHGAASARRSRRGAPGGGGFLMGRASSDSEAFPITWNGAHEPKRGTVGRGQ
jgi:hypothetical protein